MAKKTKKAKTPKAPKGRGGGKDSITGLKWNLDGFGTIESLAHKVKQAQQRKHIDPAARYLHD